GDMVGWRRLGRLAGMGIGAAAGLWVGAHLPFLAALPAFAAPAHGPLLVAGGLVLAARAWWTPRQTRGPPARRAATLVAGGFLAGLVGPFALGLARFGLDWAFGHVLRPLVVGAGSSAVHTVLTASITSWLVHRYVLRRQFTNKASGMQVAPRWAAWASAVAAFVVTTAGGLALHHFRDDLPGWPGLLLALAPGVVTFIGNLAQQKETGRTRWIKAAISGVTRSVGGVLTWLAVVHAPGVMNGWLGALTAAMLVAVAPTVVAEYLNHRVARIMAPRIKKRQEEKRKQAEQAGAPPDIGDEQRGLGQKLLDYLGFSPVDNRLLMRKAGDAVVATLATFAINQADNPTAIAVSYALAAWFVLVTGRIRDWDEFVHRFWGYKSPRTPRSPERARLSQRAANYHESLVDLLGVLGLPAPRVGDTDRPQQAADLAHQLWQLMTAEIPAAPEGWQALPPDRFDEALEQDRATARARREHHVVVTKLVPAILAADQKALERAAQELRYDGRADAANVLEFQRELSRALWDLAHQDLRGPDDPGRRHWRKRLAKELKNRITRREGHMGGPRKTLLEAIERHFFTEDPDNHEQNPDWRRAKAELRTLESELHRSRKVPDDPLVAVAEFAEQRARSASSGEQWELAAAMRLLASAALLTSEATFSRTHRDEVRQHWRNQIGHAIDPVLGSGATPNRVPKTPLERLLAVANRRVPATAERLARDYEGTPAEWAQFLEAMRELGALEGNPTDGYWATWKLSEAWHAADVRMRHALRADPRTLAGTLYEELGLLTQPRPVLDKDRVVANRKAYQAAFEALLDLLRDGDLAFRHWRDGWVDDAGLLARRLRGLR
ncbi:MAG: hypothetical protein J2P32_09710, partial [Actinobacteria bacterium]|nr:hypothetical protein [Actinomycetota bacterium]